MGKTIDERIVEMRFDNDQFEKNVNESITTIKELKKELKFDNANRELAELERASERVSFKALMNSIDAVSVKMSALSIMGKTALEEITRSAMRMGKKLVDSVRLPIVQGGYQRAQSIEQARFLLQGLLDTSEEVDAVLQNAKDSVDGTAYGFDEAAKAAAQFAATGIQAGDEMSASLAAIAGTAAMTGAEYSRVADIFTTVSGNGRLMSMQLMQMSSMGLNAAAILAKSMNKTESEIRDMVSKGKISFKEFSDAMSDAFGAHAKDANKTFTGSLANVKAALKKIGELFYTPLIEQESEVVKLLNTIRTRINQIKDGIAPSIEKASNKILEVSKSIRKILDSPLLDLELDTIRTAFHKLATVMREAKHAAKDIFPSSLIKKFEELSMAVNLVVNSFVIWPETAEKIRKAFTGLFAVIDTLAYIVGTVLKESLTTVYVLFRMITGEIFENASSITDVILEVRKWVKENNYLGKSLIFIRNILVWATYEFIQFIKNFRSMPGVQKADAILKKFANHMAIYFGGALDALFAFIDRTKQLDGITLENIKKVIADFVKNVLGYFFDIKNENNELAKAFRDLGKDIENSLRNIGVPIDTFKEKYKKLAEFIKNITSNVKFENIFVAFVGVGTIALMSKAFKGLQKLIQPITAVSDVMKSFSGVLAAYQRQIQAATLINIAIAIGVLAGSLFVIAKIPANQLLLAVGAMASLFIMIASTMAIITKAVDFVGPQDIAVIFLSLATTIGAFVGGIMLITKALKELDSPELNEYAFERSMKKLERLGVMFELFVVAMGALGIIITKVGDKGTGSDIALITQSFAVDMVALSGAILIAAKALQMLDKVQNNSFWKLAGLMLTIVASLVLIMGAANKVDFKSLAALTSIPVTIGLMVVAFKALDLMDLSDMGEKLKKIAWIIGVMLAVFVVSRAAGKYIKKAGSGILQMAIGVNLLIGAVYILGKLDRQTLNRGLETVGKLMVIFGVVASLSHWAGKYAGKTAGMFASMGIVLMECTVCIALLGLMDPANVKKGTIALVALMGAFAVCIAATGLVKDTDNIKKTLGKIIAAILVMTTGIAVIAAFSEGDSALKAADAIFTAMIGFVVAIIAVAKYANKLPEKMPKIFGKLVLVMGALGLIVTLLSNLPSNPSKIVPIALGMCVTMVAVGELMFIVSKLSKANLDFVAAGKTMLVILEVLGILGLVMVGIGGLVELFDNADVIERSLDHAVMIFNKIGLAIHGLLFGAIGGKDMSAAEEELSGIEKIGVQLSNFMQSAQPFFDGVSSMDPSIATSVAKLFGSLATIGLVTSGGLIKRLIVGKADFGDLGEALGELGDSLKDFMSDVREMNLSENDITTIDLITRIMNALSEMAKSIPNSGGLAAVIFGDNDPAEFGKSLAELIKGLNAFSSGAKGLNNSDTLEAVEVAKKTIVSLIEIGDTIQNEGGALSWIMGDNSFEKFGFSLKSFGEHLYTFATDCNDINFAAVGRASQYIQNLITILNRVSSDSPVNKQMLKDFSDAVDKLGKPLRDASYALAEFEYNTAGMDYDRVSQGLDAVKKAFSIVTDISSVALNAGTIEEMADRLRQLSEIDFNDILDKMTSVNVEKAYAAGETLANNMFLGMNSQLELSDDTINLMNSLNTINSYAPKFKDAGINLGSGFAIGIDKSSDLSRDAVEKMAQNTIDTTMSTLHEHSPSLDFIHIGNFCSIGFAEGIAALADMVLGASKDTAQGAVDEAANTISSDTSVENAAANGATDACDAAAGAVQSNTSIENAATATGNAAGQNLGNSMVSGFNSSGALSKIQSAISRVGNAMSGVINAGYTKGGEIVKAYLPTNITDKLKEYKEKLANPLKYVNDKVKETTDSVKEAVSGATDSAKSGAGGAGGAAKDAKNEFEEFRDAVKSSLEGASGLFDELSVKTDASARQMKLNLATQTAEISKWGVNLKKLASRGISKDFYKALADMGVQGAGYVSELVKLSDKELKEMQSLYSDRLSINDEVANNIANTWKNAGKKAKESFDKGVEEANKNNKNAKEKKSSKKQSPVLGVVDKNGKKKEDEEAKTIANTAKKIVSITNYSLKKDMNSLAKSMEYGGSVMKGFFKDYLVNTKNYKVGTKMVKEAKKAFDSYAKDLYKSSSYYEDDQQLLAAAKNAQKSKKAELKKLNSDLKKAKKKGDKDEITDIKSQIKRVKLEVKGAGDDIKDINKQISEHTKAAFEETYASIRNSISEFVSSIPTEFDAGINLFGDSELSLSEQIDQANTELSSLEAEQESLMADIRKYYLATDEASKETLVSLKKRLDEVNDEIDSQKSTLESLEKEEEKYTSTKILDGMKRNVNSVLEWKNNLNKLYSMPISDGLLRELKEMGPQGAEYVKAFVNMTADELSEANQLYAKKMNANNEQLLENFRDKLDMAKEWGQGLLKLGSMGLDKNIIGQIQEMGVDGGLELMRQVLSMSSGQIAEFNSEYAESLKIPDVVTDQAVESMVYAGGLACKGFNKALESLYTEGTDDNTTYQENVNEINKVWSNSCTKLGKDGANKMKKSLLNKLGKSKKEVNKAMKDVGKAAVDGFFNGVSVNKNTIIAAGEIIGTTAKKAAKKSLKSNSPSKVFEEIGKFVDQGFAKGVNDNANLMTNSVENAANNTIDAINEIVEKGSEQPTIRPVMDLTEIQNGVDTINSMSSDLGVDSSYNFAKQTMDSFNASTGTNYTLDAINRLQATLDNMGMRPNITENNTFNIEDATDPRAVAEEVNTILQKQLERRSAVWA